MKHEKKDEAQQSAQEHLLHVLGCATHAFSLHVKHYCATLV